MILKCSHVILLILVLLLSFCSYVLAYLRLHYQGIYTDPDGNKFSDFLRLSAVICLTMLNCMSCLLIEMILLPIKLAHAVKDRRD